MRRLSTWKKPTTIRPCVRCKSVDGARLMALSPPAIVLQFPGSKNCVFDGTQIAHWHHLDYNAANSANRTAVETKSRIVIGNSNLLENRPLQLNTRQIEAFRAVMLTGSMTNAAEFLRITQPAVSRLIKDLETHLKFRLFRREGNRLIPTHEGTVLFAEVDRFYVGIDRIAKIASDLQHTKAGSLRIASISALSLSCITEAIRLFHADRPAVNVMLESLNTRSIFELVAGRHFDIGFAQASGEFPGVDLTPLPPVDAVCVIPPNYPVARKQSIGPDDFRGLPFISLGKNSSFRFKIDQLFDDAQVPRHEILETSLAASVVALVASGLGVSIVDPFTVTTLRSSRFVVRPFKPCLTFDAVVVTPSHHQNSRLCSEFSGIVKRLFKSMRATHIVDGTPL